MKDEVLNSVKQELTNAVCTITLENLDQTKEQLLSYFEFLYSLKSLPTFGSVTSPIVIEEEDEEEEIRTPIKPRIPGSNVYFFDRRLRGGVVQNPNGGYPLPEKLVRDMGLHHGDQVKVIDTVMINGIARDKFEIVGRGDGTDAPRRVQLDYCIVEEAKGYIGYEVSQSAAGRILVDGEPFTFQLNQKEVLDYNVRVGDLIDIAYYNNNLDSMKLIWKHDMKDAPRTMARQTPAPKKLQANDDMDNEETKYPIDLSLFKGKNLVIVGSQYEKAKYQKTCDMLGIELTHMTGDEGKVRLRTSIKKADVVIITTQHVGHKGSIPTAELCKEYDVPMASVDRNGVQYILLEAERVMKRKIEQTA